jgi:hypothetical protein
MSAWRRRQSRLGWIRIRPEETNSAHNREQVIKRVVPAACEDQAVEALSTLAGLSSLFNRCVQSWLDDQASRYAEV